jgi:hypothetical protein
MKIPKPKFISRYKKNLFKTKKVQSKLKKLIEIDNDQKRSS